MPYILGFQQSMKMSDATKVACRWFKVGKGEVQIHLEIHKKLL